MYIIQLTDGRTYLSQDGSTFQKIKARTFAFKCHANIVAWQVGGTVIEL